MNDEIIKQRLQALGKKQVNLYCKSTGAYIGKIDADKAPIENIRISEIEKPFCEYWVFQCPHCHNIASREVRTGILGNTLICKKCNKHTKAHKTMASNGHHVTKYGPYYDPKTATAMVQKLKEIQAKNDSEMEGFI